MAELLDERMTAEEERELEEAEEITRQFCALNFRDCNLAKKELAGVLGRRAT